jgi:hypothetical protein
VIRSMQSIGQGFKAGATYSQVERGASACVKHFGRRSGGREEAGLLSKGLKGGCLVAQGWALHELVNSLAELLRQRRNVLPTHYAMSGSAQKSLRSHLQHSSRSTNHVHGGGVQIADVAEELSDDSLLLVDLGQLLCR